MHIEIDKNNLLTIFNENIPKTKQYTYHVGGYHFSDFDKGMITIHKKEIRIINLKNLGDNMSIIYIKKNSYSNKILDHEAVIHAFCLFESFDENTGQKYYFIPKFQEKNLGNTNIILEKLNIPITIQKTIKGFCIHNTPSTKLQKKYFSFLFGLSLLYGKLTIKNNELIAIKIHIPLFGQFLKYEEIFNNMQKDLAQEGIFVSTSLQKNNDGAIYQISCNDYEILEAFADYYKAIENINKIPKHEFALEIKKQLIEFITTNPEIPTEGKSKTIKQLQEGTIKLLTK